MNCLLKGGNSQDVEEDEYNVIKLIKLPPIYGDNIKENIEHWGGS